MTLPAQGTKLIESRVFVVVMVFSIVSGAISAFTPWLSNLLLQRYGLSSLEVGFVSSLLGIVQYLVSPVLFFVVLYIACGGPLLNRIASVLVSLVSGSLVGYTIGVLLGSSVVAYLVRLPSVLFLQSVSSLLQHVVGQTLLGFAVLAFSDIDLRWRSALPVDELQKKRPLGVTLLAALYVVFALVSVLALPVLTVFSSFVLPEGTLIVIIFGVVIGVTVVGLLVVAAGLYYGKKWGWILAVISSASSLVISFFTLGEIAGLTPLSTALFMLILVSLALIGGVIVNLVVLVYLLRIEVRRFFGFVNPPNQVQNKPTEVEPA